MKAFIFAAGLGTRLKPITDTMPKALVPVAGKPLLEHVITKLIGQGFNEIIINIHHFPDQIISFLKAKNNFGIRIEISDEREALLDTGGAIRKAAWFFDDGKPYLVHNMDILSNADLHALYNEHVHSGCLATLVVSERDTLRYLLFDENMHLNGWTNIQTGEVKPQGLANAGDYRKLAFSGMQVLSPEIFRLMNGMGEKFPIMDFYIANASTQTISGYIPGNFKMLDVGKLNVLEQAEQFVREQSSGLHLG